MTLLFVFFALAYNVLALADFNKKLGADLYNFLGNGWVSVATVITYIGSAYISLPVTGILALYLLFRKHYWIALLLVYNLFGVRLLTKLLKSIFEVARPVLEHLVHVSSYSFPSGHSMNSIAFFGLLLFLFSQHIARTKSQSTGIWTAGSMLIILIGISRVYLGVHFPLDVLGGFAGGGAWLLLSIYIYTFLPLRETSDERVGSGERS